MASINLQGDTSGSISISAPSVAGSNTLTLPATTQTLATQNALGVRNLIINGDMRIDQRNGGASITANDQTFVVDRFKFRARLSSKMTAEQVTDVPTGQGFQYSTKITSSSAYTVVSNDYFNFQQILEGQDISHLMFGTSDAKTVTLSFWVKSSLTGNFAVALNNYQASTRTYPAEYTINTANTWEKKTITISGDTSGTWDTDNTAGLGIIFNLGYGSDYHGTKDSWNGSDYSSFSGAVNLIETNGATLYITGVQLEVGDTATPFEHRPYDMELARCKRYYENIPKVAIQSVICNAHCWNTTTAYGTFQYATKRAAPSLTLTATDYIVRFGGSTNNVTSTNISQITVDRCQLGLVTSGLTVGYGAWLAFDSDPVTNQKLEINAEL